MLAFLIALTREEKIRPRSGRAGPSFSVRPEKEAKGAVCTALRQQKDRDTLKTVRRTFPNSTIHIVSNTWEGSFLPSGQKSPHEPRSQILRVLPWPSISGYAEESEAREQLGDSNDRLRNSVLCAKMWFHKKAYAEN